MRPHLPLTHAAAAASALALCPTADADIDRPNILFIFSDDHRADALGVTNPEVRTPNLDALAAASVRFDRAYVTTAICSPSRAAVLSGRYGSRNGVATLSDALNTPDHTFAQYLRGAGYRTAQFGKWHLGTTPEEAGFDDYARINSNGSWFNRNIDTNIDGVAGNLGGTFYEEFMADAVIDYLGAHTSTRPDRPFVLWWSNQVPHLDGRLAYPDVDGTQGSYEVADMTVPASWSDPLVTKPPYLATSRFVTKSATENYGGPGGYTNPAPGVRNATLAEDNVQQHLLEYYASITSLDAQIGRVLDRLDDPDGDGDTADSITEDTWVVFMGDNGWQTGHHKFTSKVLAYEESARVPLLVRAPGVTPRTESQLVSNIDLAPMFLDIANLSPAPQHQGQNLAQLIRDPGSAWRAHLYYEAVIPEPSLGAEPHDAVLDSRYKLIRTYDDSTASNVVFEELYDLQSEPAELTNLAADPAHAAVKTALETALAEQRAAVAASPDPASPGGNLLANPSFDTGDKTAWRSNAGDTSTVVATPLDDGTHALRFNTGSATSWVDQVGLDLGDFVVSWLFRFDGAISSRVMNFHLRSNDSDRLNARIAAAGNALQFYNGSAWITPTGVNGSNSFEAGTTYRFTVTGTDWGDTSSTAPDAGTYTLAWEDLGDGSSSGSFSSGGQSNDGYRYDPPNTVAGGELDGIRFLDDFGDAADPDWRVDAVSILSLGPPPPPLVPDKVVNIAGVYPHLAMTNSSNECGPGAVVPWADRLWCVTYSPHEPRGSSSKLYEIDIDLNRVVRPESVGGTPANRFIHTPSNQLIIGPHFIDAERNVRTLPYSAMPGRHTGVAAHLTDPDHRVYLMTMENGVYDIDVNDLSSITRYPDIQGRGDRFLFGYHGKGLYSGQGLLVAANNGRPNNQNDPRGAAGVLATWDGTTVADNGGSYLATNDPNASEPSNNPVAPQPDYIAGWDQIDKVQTCEVTGPGGIYGNPNPSTDPIWTTAFDAKSVILRTLEGGRWHTWRLPKGSYTHDGSHGWHTEWPRIRQLDPGVAGSPYLMHMHGLFFDFPPTFSSTDASGLSPICSYYKMPVDYCTFEGRLVIAKNDASKFSNALAPKAQSNFWFGGLEDLQSWGAPSGHGSVWMDEDVAAGESSAPFLTNGFTHRSLHLRNGGATATTITIETSHAAATWSEARTVALAAGTYAFENLSDIDSGWVRLRSGAAASDLTAFFHLSNPYPHAPVASLGTDRFAALADIRDTDGHSDGVIRVMPGEDLKLEFASNSGYHQIGGDMELCDVDDAALEADLRADAELEQEFGSDAASAWIESGGTRFRVPKLDPLYDQPFLSGWARGEREAVTERKLFNLHGTFYEIPRANSGGVRKMRALSSHGKRITDFASWRGLWVLTGVLDDAPASDSLVRTPGGQAALWLGEIDELWQMGEPRGIGGPWRDSTVTADTASDPFLMYGYDRKELRLSHTSTGAVTFTLELDFLADNTWSTYQNITVPAGETVIHLFPTGFHAHWIRVRSDTATEATAQFHYGPADRRDALLDWARDRNLPTGVGRSAVAASNPDLDPLPNLAEFAFGADPFSYSTNPLTVTAGGDALLDVRDLAIGDGVSVAFELSSDLEVWNAQPSEPAPDQTGVPSGFTRLRVALDPISGKRFARARVEI